MNIDVLHVGQARKEWAGETDGYIMEYSNVSGLILYVFFKRPQEEEIREFAENGGFKIAFMDYKGVGFFCLKFGNLPWGDCAFSPNLYDEKPYFDDLEDGKGYALNVVLIDGETGTIKAIRQIGLGNGFSKSFREWCEESLRRRMTRHWYMEAVNECYEKYETEQLARRAAFRYEIPHREDREQERG